MSRGIFLASEITFVGVQAGLRRAGDAFELTAVVSDGAAGRRPEDGAAPGSGQHAAGTDATLAAAHAEAVAAQGRRRQRRAGGVAGAADDAGAVARLGGRLGGRLVGPQPVRAHQLQPLLLRLQELPDRAHVLGGT